MNITFERFSARAQRTLGLAQSEAQRLNHSHVEPEHLLLALTQLDDSAAAKVLGQVNASFDQIRARVEQLIGQGSEPTSDAMALTPRTKRAILAAIAEADQMEQRRIGTLHLLLGLLQEGEGVALKVLTEWGVRVDNVRAQTAQLSLEMPVGTEDSSQLGDFIEDESMESPTDAASNQLLREQVQNILGSLSKREREVLEMRFGLKDGQGHTLEEVGQAFGVTRERIRQIEAKALRKLRHPFRSRKLRDYLT